MDFFKQNIIPGEVVVQLAAFLIVFFTLKRLAWGPILKALDSRRERIQGDFDKIDLGKKEIDTLKAEYMAQLARIEEEARAKLQESIEEGRRLARDLQEKARAEAQSVFDKTKENLTLEIAKAKLELKRDIAGLSLQVAEKILDEKLNDTKQQEKIQQMIAEIEAGGRLT